MRTDGYIVSIIEMLGTRHNSAVLDWEGCLAEVRKQAAAGESFQVIQVVGRERCRLSDEDNEIVEAVIKEVRP